MQDQWPRWDLPPDLRSSAEAPPGEHTLRSTGEVVVGPDVTVTRTITRPAAEDDPPDTWDGRAAENERLGFGIPEP